MPPSIEQSREEADDDTRRPTASESAVHNLERTLRDHDKLLGKYYHMRSIEEIRRQRDCHLDMRISNAAEQPVRHERSLSGHTHEGLNRSISRLKSPPRNCTSKSQPYQNRYTHKRALSSSDPSSSSQVL